MANSNTPYGLRPINMNGTPWSGQGMMVFFNSDDSAAVYIGDPIKATGETDAFGVPEVTIASAGDTDVVLGCLLGMSNGPAGSGITLTRDSPVYRPASLTNYGLIVDDPDQLYAIQEDSVGGAIAITAAAFANANFVSGTGSTVTGYSGWMLDSSSVGTSTDTTFQLKIIGLLRGPDNAVGNYAKWVVKLNNPQFASTTAF